MKKRLFLKVLMAFVLCLALVFTAAAGAEEKPAGAARTTLPLAPAPEKSIYCVLRLESVGDFLRWAFSERNIRTVAPLAELDEDTVRLALALLEKVPAMPAALIAGSRENGEAFFQLALNMPSSPQFERVASGKASGQDVLDLVLGSSGASGSGPEDAFISTLLAPALSLKEKDGIFELFDGELALGAKNGVLLLALSAVDVKAGLAALEDETKALTFERHFTTKDFALLHADLETAIKLSAARAENEKERAEALAASEKLKDVFKAPLNTEFGFESFPEKFLLSVRMNLKEAVTEKYALAMTETEPVPGGRIHLMGTGSPLFALGTVLNAGDFQDSSALKEIWPEILKSLEALGISEKELKELVHGAFSLVVDSGTVLYEGLRIPALYVTQDGKPGEAGALFSKFLDKLEADEKARFAPVQAKGWEKMFQLDSSLSPVSCLVGTNEKTLFLGLTDAASLEREPSPAPKLKELLDKKSTGSLYIDFAGIQNYLRSEDSLTALLLPLMELPEIPAFRSAIQEVLNAKLSIPSVSLWGPESEKFFVEFALADVPPHEGLWTALVRAAEKLADAIPEETGKAEETKTKTNGTEPAGDATNRGKKE